MTELNDILANLLLRVSPKDIERACIDNQEYAAVCADAQFRKLYAEKWGAELIDYIRYPDRNALGTLQRALALGSADTITLQIENFVSDYEDKGLEITTATKEIHNNGPLFTEFVDYVMEPIEETVELAFNDSYKENFTMFKVWFETWAVGDRERARFSKNVLITLPSADGFETLYFEKGIRIPDMLRQSKQLAKCIFVRFTGTDSSFIKLEGIIAQ